MEQEQNKLDMLDLIVQPAFCVKDGVIVRTNLAAVQRMVCSGEAVEPLLQTGKEEYRAFRGGMLYLTLKIAGTTCGASVARVNDDDVFLLDFDSDNEQLQAMALAAREIRGLLSDVMTVTERLFPISSDSGLPEDQELAGRINRGLFQMLRVVGNMSDAPDYAAGTIGRQEIRDYRSVFQEIFDKASALVAQAGIAIHFSNQLETIPSLLDYEKLERAVYNIVSNAVKYTPAGGTIDAKLSRTGRTVYLTVSNSGCDIPPDTKGTIFRRYQRKPTLEDSRNGIGLGMVLIRSAATAHGGTVLIEQSAEIGFRITLSMAIRQPTGSVVRSSALRVDYAGERDHGLIELSGSLPAELYKP